MDCTTLPTVTVSVISYNSSKTIVETLDSIDRQTYPHLELVISDDGSKDDTVRICEEWISRHWDRFARTEIITSPHNTGVSANLNRAWDACRTKWDKDIAGDDILFPNCIEDNIAFVKEHPDAVVVFSRARIFETRHHKRIWLNESWHNYDFFSLSPKDQYDYLIHEDNCLPAPSCFYNLEKLRAMGIRNDERIPLLEDYPKWIVFARRGIRFDFLDHPTVGYRHDSDSLSAGIFSPLFFKSNLLFYLYYYLDEINEEHSRDDVYAMMSDKVLSFYTKTYERAAQINTSWDYRVGHILLSPIHFIKDILLQLKK